MGKTRVHKIYRTLVGTLVSIFVLLSINVLGDEWTTKHDIETSDYPSVDGDLIIKSNTTTIKSGGVLTVNGNMTIKSTTKINSGGTLIVNGNLEVDISGGTEFPIVGELIVNGKMTIKSGTSISGNLTVNGDLEINKGTISVSGNLTVQGGNLHLNSTLGAITFNFNDPSNIIVSNRKKVNGVIVEELKNKGNLIFEGSYTINFNDKNKNPKLYVYNNIEQKCYVNYKGTNKKSEYHIGGSFINTYETKGLTDYIKSEHIVERENISALLPIELTSFTVSATEYGYTFNWVTASEVENDYFTLEFSENGEEFIAIDYVSGAGTTSETTEYEYVWDANPTAEILYFRLKQTDYNGEFTYSDILVFAPKKSHGANRILYYGPLKLNVVDGQLQYIVE